MKAENKMERRGKIEELIPHRGAMKLIDGIVEVGMETAVTTATVTEKWPLADTDSVSPIVMIELVAQTIGVCHGWRELETKGIKNGGRGWIVGIKKADFHLDRIPLNCRVTTRTEKRFSYDNYLEIIGIIKIGKKLIGKIILQVFRPEAE